MGRSARPFPPGSTTHTGWASADRDTVPRTQLSSPCAAFRWISIVSVAVVLVPLTSGCLTVDHGGQGPEQLAFDQGKIPPATVGSESTTTTVQAASPPTVVEQPPIPLGSDGRPFVELPAAETAPAVRTPTGIVLPVLGERDDSWMV